MSKPFFEEEKPVKNTGWLGSKPKTPLPPPTEDAPGEGAFKKGFKIEQKKDGKK